MANRGGCLPVNLVLATGPGFTVGGRERERHHPYRARGRGKGAERDNCMGGLFRAYHGISAKTGYPETPRRALQCRRRPQTANGSRLARLSLSGRFSARAIPHDPPREDEKVWSGYEKGGGGLYWAGKAPPLNKQWTHLLEAGMMN